MCGGWDGVSSCPGSSVGLERLTKGMVSRNLGHCHRCVFTPKHTVNLVLTFKGKLNVKIVTKCPRLSLSNNETTEALSCFLLAFVSFSESLFAFVSFC